MTIKQIVTDSLQANVITSDKIAANAIQQYHLDAANIALGGGGSGGNVTINTTAPNVLLSNPGDFWINADTGKQYLLIEDEDSSQWVEIASTFNGFALPNVITVNGLTGAVVLRTDNIEENGNLYYTNARVYANVSLGFSEVITNSYNQANAAYNAANSAATLIVSPFLLMGG